MTVFKTPAAFKGEIIYNHAPDTVWFDDGMEEDFGVPVRPALENLLIGILVAACLLFGWLAAAVFTALA